MQYFAPGHCMHVSFASLRMRWCLMCVAWWIHAWGRSEQASLSAAHTASLGMHATHVFWSGNCQCRDTDRPRPRPAGFCMTAWGRGSMDVLYDARTPFRPFPCSVSIITWSRKECFVYILSFLLYICNLEYHLYYISDTYSLHSKL